MKKKQSILENCYLFLHKIFTNFTAAFCIIVIKDIAQVGLFSETPKQTPNLNDNVNGNVNA